MKDNNVLVSVLMATFNVEKYINEAIDSVLAQSYSNYELIISDDASTDNTLNLIKQYKDNRIKIIENKSNNGYVKNMNILLNSAKGDYIMIQDGDDYSEKNRIEVLLSAIMNNPNLSMVGSNLVRINDEKVILEKSNFPTDTGVIQQKFDTMDHDSPVVCGTTLFKREIIDSKLLFRDLIFIKRGQDNDFLFRISENFKIGNVSDYLYYYRYNPQSMTLNIKNQNIYDYFSWDYICFLKKERNTNKSSDSLEQNKLSNISAFFKKLIDEKENVAPAFYEISMANRSLVMGEKKYAITFLFKALYKKPHINILKKIVYVLMN